MDKEALDAAIEKIKIALDGRSYRWLSLEIRMPESELSKRMNGKIKFTEDELLAIDRRLNYNLIEKIPIIQE